MQRGSTEESRTNSAAKRRKSSSSAPTSRRRLRSSSSSGKRKRRFPANVFQWATSFLAFLSTLAATVSRSIADLFSRVAWFAQWCMQAMIASPLRKPFEWIYGYPARLHWRRTTNRFLSVMRTTESYSTYRATACNLDHHSGVDAWRTRAPPRSLSNAEGLLLDAHVALALARSGNYIAMSLFLRTMLLRGAHGMCNQSLYEYFTEAKSCIEDYCAAITCLVEVFAGVRTPGEVNVIIRPCFIPKETNRMRLQSCARAFLNKAVRRRNASSSPAPSRTSGSNAAAPQFSAGATAAAATVESDMWDLNAEVEETVANYMRQALAKKAKDEQSVVDSIATGGPNGRGLPSLSVATTKLPAVSATGKDDTGGEAVCNNSFTDPTGAQLSTQPPSPNDTAAALPLISSRCGDALASKKGSKKQRVHIITTFPRQSTPGNDTTFLRGMVEWAYMHLPNEQPQLSCSNQVEVLRDTLRSFGRTALVLSGGASMGAYHAGVVRALFDARVLPSIMSGSSAGSIIASLICTKHPTELARFMKSDVLSADALQLTPFGEDTGVAQKLRHFFRTGVLMDVRSLMECIRGHCGDMTFLQAFNLTGKALNISVTRDGQKGTHEDRHVLLNYLTSPNVVIWSAVSASCALPGLFTAVQLIQKSPRDDSFSPYQPGELWCDGSVAQDVPRDRLSELFHVNFVIVSQVNPFVIPFMSAPPSTLVVSSRRSLLGRLYFAAVNELRHWLVSAFDIGLLPKSGVLEVPYMLLTQYYGGNVTILPVGDIFSSAPDYLNIVNNPTAEYISFVASRAQVRTWPYVTRIRYATMIERALVGALQVLEQQQQQQRQKQKGRLKC